MSYKFPVYFNQSYTHHNLPKKHPDQAERMTALLKYLKREHSATLIDLIPISLDQNLLDTDLLNQIHQQSYIDSLTLKASSLQSHEKYHKIDDDTFISSLSINVALEALQTISVACNHLLYQNIEHLFCAVRPPGHHATESSAFGFCLFNNVAFATETLLKNPSIQKVAILDFDAHHCNGTINILQNRSDILICSIFEENGYPFQQFEATNLIETPLASQTSGKEFIEKIKLWYQKIEALSPDCLVISAGFDAHKNDPMSTLQLSEEDYFKLGNFVSKLSKRCLIGSCSILEGGYSITHLPSSVFAYIQGLSTRKI